jgi:hypothetical protein
MATKRTHSTVEYYDPKDLQDAPEYFEYARAMGTLTWGSWDHGIRSQEERVKDFMAAYPPADPTRFAPGGSLVRQADGTYAPGSPATRMQRFLSMDWRPGSLHELLSRYGLKTPSAPPHDARLFTAGAFRETAKKRNHRLRMLHGGVDIEPADMDAAKAEFLDLQERKRAAEETREAIRRMKAELGDKGPNP